MKSIVLPAGTEHVLFGDLAHLIADALWPDAGPNDDRLVYGCARVNLDAELVRAVKSEALPVKDPLTYGPHTFPIGDALNRALVTVDDLREFVAGRGMSVVAEAPGPQTSPVPTLGASGGMNWTLNKPQRIQGYGKPLYDLLKAAHLAGLPRPSAREVLEAWRDRAPVEVAKVMAASFDYYDAEGNTKEADLDAIRKAVDRMTGKPAR